MNVGADLRGGGFGLAGPREMEKDEDGVAGGIWEAMADRGEGEGGGAGGGEEKRGGREGGGDGRRGLDSRVLV